SIVWDKFAKQAINRGRMNYLGRVGSDTGIRTRVSAVRGRRPGPLDDIALESRSRSCCVHIILKFSHAPPPRASRRSSPAGVTLSFPPRPAARTTPRLPPLALFPANRETSAQSGLCDRPNLSHMDASRPPASIQYPLLAPSPQRAAR